MPSKKNKMPKKERKVKSGEKVVPVLTNWKIKRKRTKNIFDR